MLHGIFQTQLGIGSHLKQQAGPPGRLQIGFSWASLGIFVDFIGNLLLNKHRVYEIGAYGFEREGLIFCFTTSVIKDGLGRQQKQFSWDSSSICCCCKTLLGVVLSLKYVDNSVLGINPSLKVVSHFWFFLMKRLIF